MMKTLVAFVITLIGAIVFSSCASRSTSSEANARTAITTTTTTEATTVTTMPKTTTEAIATTTSVTEKASSVAPTTSSTSHSRLIAPVTKKASALQATTTTENKNASTTKVCSTTVQKSTKKVSTTTAIKATTTVAKKAEPKKRVQLLVENIQQCPELPMGCECVSASIVLKWYGFKVDKFSLIPYQPMWEQPTKDGIWGNPYEVFVGNPRTYKWGCYSPVIKKAIENYFADNHVTNYEVISLDGSELTDLYKEIDQNNPIILWVTTFMQDVEAGETWKLEDGSTFTWTKHEHCVALIGFDTEKDTVIISDPYDSKGTVEYSRKKVERVYNQLGKMALVVHKRKESNGFVPKLLAIFKR